MQRVRVTFSRGEQTKYVPHLDIMRYWERAFRRAGIPIAYSEGFRPHPRFSIASPLAVGVTSEGELMDVFLEREMPLGQFLRDLAAQMVSDIQVHSVEAVDAESPSLQSLLRAVEYRVGVATTKGRDQVELAVGELMAKESLPWEHLRDGEARRYDLRALIHELRLEQWSEGTTEFWMRLRADTSGAGRPEQVALALGYQEQPEHIHRVRLLIAAPPVKPASSGRRPKASGEAEA